MFMSTNGMKAIQCSTKNGQLAKNNKMWGGHRGHGDTASILLYYARRKAGQNSTAQNYKFIGVLQQ
jgi:hypothetical protein